MSGAWLTCPMNRITRATGPAALVISILAFFAATSLGSAYAVTTIAATQIANKSVTTKKLANKAVTTKKLAKKAVKAKNLAKNAVRSKHIKNGTITAKDIKDGSLDADLFDSSTLSRLKGEKGDTGAQGLKGDTGDQGPQGVPGVDGVDGLSGVQMITAAWAETTATGTSVAICPAGKIVISGGHSTRAGSGDFRIRSSVPGGDRWMVGFSSADGDSVEVRAYALCVNS